MITISEKIRFIESVFGRAKIYAKNVDVHCPLPACKDSNKKRLSIRLDDEMNHCWVCGWGARNLLPLLMKCGTSEEIQEYRTKFLADKKEINYNNTEINSQDEEKIIVKLPSDFKLIALNTRTRDSDVKSCRKYAESRGVTEKEFWNWKLGTSNEPNLRRRIIMPSFSCDGRLNYYVARAIDKISYMKYINSDGDSKNIVFNELNIDWSKRLTIVEGPFDLIKCRNNATCLLGSSLSERSELFTQLLNHQTPVTLMLDNDMGQKTQTIGKFLNQYSIDVNIAYLEKDKDPGDMTKDEVDKAIIDAKPWSWGSMLTYKLNNASICTLKMQKTTNQVYY